MKWKTIGWWVMGFIALLTGLTANNYEESWKNLVSFSPLLTTISNALIAFLTNHWVQLTATAVAFGYLGYQVAVFKAGKASKRLAEESKPAEHILERVIDNAQSNTTPRAVPKYPSLTADQITYAIREVSTILARPTYPDNDELERHLGLIKRDHAIWHILANYNARDTFIQVVADARKARKEAGDSFYPMRNDYTGTGRDKHVERIKNTANNLIDSLYSPASTAKFEQIARA